MLAIPQSETFLKGRVIQHCGDVREILACLPDDHFDCVVTSPPYWGLRDYGVAGQLGLERSLGEHIGVMVEVFREVRRVLKPTGTLWLNYGDCYATSPNGRSAADTKAVGNDDRTFRDKPFSTIGPILKWSHANQVRNRNSRSKESYRPDAGNRIHAGGYLKPKDLCMIPNRLAIALQDDGWWVRAENVWGKPNPMPDSSGKYRPSSAHEKIFMLSKSGKCFYDADAVALPCSPNTHARIAQNIANQIGSTRANAGGKTNGNMKAVVRKQDGHGRRYGGFNERYFGGKIAEAGSGVRNNHSMVDATCLLTDTRYLRNFEAAPLQTWVIGTSPFSEAHFATFPPDLAERCIRAGCPEGGEVLDPFGGAGTSALVAASLGRRATLIELNPEYCRLARARIEAAFMGKEEGQRHMTRQLGRTADAGPLFSGAPA